MMEIESLSVMQFPDDPGKVRLSISVKVYSVDEAMRRAAMFIGGPPVPIAQPAPAEAVKTPVAEENSQKTQIADAILTAAAQGVDFTAPSKLLLAASDYDSMDRAALKELCIRHGLTTASNKSGAAAFKALLQDADAKASATTPSVVVETVVEPRPSTVDWTSRPVAGSTQVVSTPAELVNATSFRQVMTWMLDNGFNSRDAILAACDQHKPNVAAIQRLSGDLGDRIGRALEVLKMEMA